MENTLLQVVPRLPLPLLKICDFGYSKADYKSAAKSKVCFGGWFFFQAAGGGEAGGSCVCVCLQFSTHTHPPS